MKVSVGIPFYNPGDYLRDAICSVLAQSFTDFELILLDDGSTDHSLAIAQSFADPRIKVISDGKNLGLPARLNQLITLAQGEYLARMDADDLISINKLQQQVEFLDKQPNIDIVSTGICTITNDNQVIGYRQTRHQTHCDFNPAEVIMGEADIAHATIMARKSWYLNNRYNEDAKLMEDYQLWIDAAIKHDLKVGYLPSPMYFYREESSVTTAKAINAYINQFTLVFNRYFDLLSFTDKCKFISLTLAKIVIVYSLNLLKSSSKLLALRNKNTSQNKSRIQALQQELDNLRIIP
ncbi:glycosyltransferase family 2 protein [Colwelliaceae bacterium 6471]